MSYVEYGNIDGQNFRAPIHRSGQVNIETRSSKICPADQVIRKQMIIDQWEKASVLPGISAFRDCAESTAERDVLPGDVVDMLRRPFVDPTSNFSTEQQRISRNNV